MAKRSSWTAGRVAQAFQDYQAGVSIPSETRESPRAVATLVTYALGRVTGRALVAIAILAAVMWVSEASEPNQIWTPAELSTWAASLESDKGPMKASDCVDDAERADAACLRRYFYGLDLSREAGK